MRYIVCSVCQTLLLVSERHYLEYMKRSDSALICIRCIGKSERAKSSKCECGANATSNKNLHSTWCPCYEE